MIAFSIQPTTTDGMAFHCQYGSGFDRQPYSVSNYARKVFEWQIALFGHKILIESYCIQLLDTILVRHLQLVCQHFLCIVDVSN